MGEQIKSITERTFIPISMMIGISFAVGAVVEWRRDGEENAHRIQALERRVDGLSSIRDDVAQIKFKVDLIRVEVRKPR